ncbi:MAG: HDIG domain-containing protein [Lachnospiraceae bacterium]|nr:HDIG domain-containing protein [Lachnospiraceae bacterium]
MIQIPEQVAFIIHKLEEYGFEAYAVGGCVRDTLLGRIPGDWDITTSALPEQVKAIFRRTIDTGIEHGTVTVMMGREGYEVTTYRVDGDYQDGRHPSSVTFTPSLIEDLKRRDFTINAMAFRPDKDNAANQCPPSSHVDAVSGAETIDPATSAAISSARGIVDCFDGMGDLENKIIRCVGDPEERFREDALRMMRAVRFAAQLGFTIEENTKAAIRKLAGNLRLISKERIQVELIKLLTSPHPDYIRIAYETGITAVVLPEFDRLMNTPQRNPFHSMTVGEHTIQSLLAIDPDPVLRLTMLLHDIGKPATLRTDPDGCTHFTNHAFIGADMAHDILRGLKFDNHTVDAVTALIRWHDSFRDCLDTSVDPPVVRKRAVRRIANKIGRDLFPALIQVNYADNMAKSEYARSLIVPAIELIERAYGEIIADDDCLSLKELAINGKDLMDLGLKPGKEIGLILNHCLDLVLDDPEMNRRETLSEIAKAMIAKLSSEA